MRWFPLLVLALGAAAYGLYKLNYPTYSWHQKLTLVVETPDGPRTGSAVTAIKQAFHPRIPAEAGVRKSSLRGEAVVVDLGAGRYLFALLRGGDVVSGAFGDRLPQDDCCSKERFRATERLRRAGPAPVPFKALPVLVTFGDIDDPSSVMQVDPDNLAASFGAGHALREVTLAITDAPVTEGVVEGVLGWWCDYRTRQARLNGSTSIAVSTNDLSDVLGTGAFRVGDCI